MIWHPLALSIWLLDITAGLIYIGAGWRLLVLLPQWQPGSSAAGQLWRERALELTAYQGRWTMGLLTVSLVLVLVGLTNVWPAQVAGAMCGTGVLQAMGPAGHHSLIFRVLTLGLLYCWQVVQRLDRTHPGAFLAKTQGRMLLLAAPLIVLSTLTFGKALAAVVPESVVSCCALLYEQARVVNARPLLSAIGVSERTWMVVFFCGAVGVAGAGAWQWRRPILLNKPRAMITAAVTAVWIPLAIVHLKSGVAPYIYQVLAHHCAWCLFLTLHGAVGFIYFGLLAWIAAETAAGLTVRAVVPQHAPLHAAACMRMSTAGRRILAGALLFVALSAAPALLWRIQTGSWIF
jgi:hypothetical protein